MTSREASRAQREIQNLREENARLMSRLSSLSRLSLLITRSLDRTTVLQEVVDAACELTCARYGALGVFDGSGRIQEFITHGITPEERARIGDLPQGLGILGLLQHRQQPLRLADLTKHPRSVGFPPNHPTMKTFLGAPVRLGDESLGNLYLTEKLNDQEFTPEDENLLMLFASHAAIAIKNASQYTRESELRNQAELERARLRAIIESSPSAVIVAEAHGGRIVLANEAANRLLGIVLRPGEHKERYERAAVYRRPDGSIYAPEELPLQRAIREGVTSRGVEVIFDLPDGRKVPTLVNAAPVRDAEGKITAAIAVIEDISDRQAVERMKADFLSMISHDLRGPLSTIKGLSSALLMEQESIDMATVMEYVNSIDEEADRMAELVNNLLEMSRLEARAMPMAPEMCHLADIAAESVKRIERSRIGGAHKITVNVPTELPEIYADYDEIGRVLGNILSNAIKYSPEGSEIVVRSYRDPKDSHMIVTEVKDQGVGIPDSEMDKLFTKFYRVTSQQGRSRPGSGLGLAICKAIVEAHGGRVWVESKLGAGSSFYFSLPTAAKGAET